MSFSYEKEFQKILKKEEQFLAGGGNKLKERGIDFGKVQEKIPDKLVATVYVTLNRVFGLMFDKGTNTIEKTFKKVSLKEEFLVNDFRLEHLPSAKAMRKIEREVKKRQALNSGTTIIEGSGLGLLGVGVPDIPVFIGVILRGIYEVSCSYGFDYEKDEERVFILRCISASLAPQEERRKKDGLVEDWIKKIEEGNPELLLKAEIEETSQALTEEILVAKFLQGFLVIGVIGGPMNFATYNKLLNYATLKYKKRYLSKKLRGKRA